MEKKIGIGERREYTFLILQSVWSLGYENSDITVRKINTEAARWTRDSGTITDKDNQFSNRRSY